MESWTIFSDGDGNLVAIPTAILGLGLIGLFILGVFRALTNGATQMLTKFANSYSWIIVFVLVVLGIIIAVFVGISKGKDRIIHSILFGISLPLSLALLYGFGLDGLIAFAESLEEVFIPTLVMSPIYLLIILLQFAITFALGLTPFLIPVLEALDFLSKYLLKEKTERCISLLLGIVGIPVLFYLLFCQCNLPAYLMGCG